jgi:hypothetical protein
MPFVPLNAQNAQPVMKTGPNPMLIGDSPDSGIKPATPGFKPLDAQQVQEQNLADIIKNQKDPNQQAAAVGALMDHSNTILGKLSEFANNVKAKIGDRNKTLVEDWEKTAEGKINPAEIGIRTFGGLAGGIGDVLMESLKAIAPERMAALQDNIGKITQEAMKIPGASTLVTKLTEWGKKHPEAARDIQSAIDIAAFTPIGKGASMAEESIIKPVKEAVALAVKPNLLARATKALTLTDKEMVAKELTDNILKYHADPGGFFSRMSATTPADGLALRLQDKVISSNPIRNINNLQREFIKEDLRVGRNLFTEKIPYDPKALGDYLFAKIKDIADIKANPDALAAFKEKLVADFVNQPKTPELGPLWRARKAFDRIVESKYKIFSGSDTTAKDIMRELRNGTQEFIAKVSKQAGSKFDYAGAMSRMTDMYDAAAIFAQKATKKMGTSGAERLMATFADKIDAVIPVKTLIKKVLFK